VRLEGSLDAFSLPDIFQLLSFTKKTGALHLRRDVAHGVVYVTTGALTGGSSDVRRQGLARRLVGTGAVGDDALTEAVATATDASDVGVARALLQAGAVDEGALHEAAAEHVIDTVFDLMRWSDGDFAFVVDEANPDDVGVSVSVEDAVAEAHRRLETWAQVSTTVPSPDTVLAVALSLPEDPVLSREEWALLALVDGRREVSAVVAATGRGEFAVVSTLASLVERGLLVVTSEGEPPAVQTLLRRLGALASLEVGEVGSVATAEAEEPADDTIERLGAALSEDLVTDIAETPAQRQPVDKTVRAKADVVNDADADNADGEDEAADEVADEAAVIEDFPAEVVPPRAEPFLPRRRPEHPDDDFAAVTAAVSASMSSVVGQVDGTAAVAAEPVPSGLIERDPSVNKSLLLRLIAGVRGL
jgi:hypothetical protein